MERKKSELILGFVSFAILLSAIFVYSSASFAQTTKTEVQQKLDEAERSRKENNITKAISIANEVLAGDPKSVPALGFLGTTYLQQGKYETALKYMDNALAISPLNTFILRIKGETLMQQAKFKEAEDILNKALELAKPKTSDRAWVLYTFSKLYVTQKQPRDIVESFFQRAIEEDPSNTFFKEELKKFQSLQSQPKL